MADDGDGVIAGALILFCCFGLTQCYYQTTHKWSVKAAAEDGCEKLYASEDDTEQIVDDVVDHASYWGYLCSKIGFLPDKWYQERLDEAFIESATELHLIAGDHSHPH